MKLDKGRERGRDNIRSRIAPLAPESESIPERGTLLVFLDWCIGHGAPPLTRCVVASLGASIRSSARRGAIIVAPAAGATVKGLSCLQLRQRGNVRRDAPASSRVRSFHGARLPRPIVRHD
jgi:hypothetical protein